MAKNFEVTAEEADKLSKALKDEEFRKLFFEYAQEISDPENKRKYEEELIELEKMRGVDMKFIKPTPGFVLKSYILPEGEQKLFVNICMTDTLDPGSSKPVKKSDGKIGEDWNIPYSLTPPRDDQDKAKKKCTVIDVMFHPDTYSRGTKNPRLKQLLVDTALDGIEQNYKIKADRKRIKNLVMSYKGVVPSTVIRVPKDEVKDRPDTVDLGGLPLKVPYPPLKQDSTKDKVKEKKIRPPSEPRYNILHSGEFTMQDFTHDRESSQIKRPKKLVVSIELPGVKSASDVDLDIFEKRLTLECAHPTYKLDLALSYPVDSDKGSAKFDKTKQVLSVTLPVLSPPPMDLPLIIPKPLVSELEPALEDSGSQSTNQDEDEISHDITEVVVLNGCNELTENAPSNEASDVTPSVQEWTSIGEWCCPPFSYRQDDSSVTFLLKTANVKEGSFVTNFSQNSAHLTYRGENNYSFCVCFNDECLLDSDDCVVDVSDDNVALLLTKESKGLWHRFQVGLNPSQAKEKLFLTELNVESTIEKMESFTDPWVNKTSLSDSAQVEIVSQNESQLDIRVSDQQTDSSVEESSCNEEASITDQHKVTPSNTSTTEISEDEGDTTSTKENPPEARVQKDTPNADLAEGTSCVTVEEDGSMFVQANSDYVESRKKGRVKFVNQTKAGGEIQFSNKLMFSLD